MAGGRTQNEGFPRCSLPDPARCTSHSRKLTPVPAWLIVTNISPVFHRGGGMHHFLKRQHLKIKVVALVKST